MTQSVPEDRDQDPRLPVILRHARRAFIAEGYDGARMEPVARAAGVSTATLYTFFAGKAELFEAVIGELSVEFRRQMDGVVMHDGDARQQLIQFAEAYGRFMSDPFVQSILRLVMSERHRFPQMAEDFFERGRRDFGGVVISAIMRLRRPGEMEMDMAIQAAEQLLGMVEHTTFVVPILGGTPRRPERSLHEIAVEAVTTILARYGRLVDGHG